MSAERAALSKYGSTHCFTFSIFEIAKRVHKWIPLAAPDTALCGKMK